MTGEINLAVAVFGLASAASWGAADFNGGMAAKRANAFVVVAASQGVGLLLLVGLVFVLQVLLPPLSSLVWGSSAGLFGGIGLAALYRALAIGNMGVAAPITAVLSAALPVLFASLTQGVPGAFQITGFGLGLLGVWLLSRPEGSDNHPQGLGLALVAGVGFGGFLILINQAGGTGFLWSLASARATSLVLMSIIALGVSRRGPVQLARGLFVPIILSGVLDVGGNAFFVLAAQVGRLDVAAVLSSLYPATTVLLAWLLLKERMTRAQTAGIVAALLAIPLITTS